MGLRLFLLALGELEQFSHLSLATCAGAIDVDDSVADGEAAGVVGLEAGCQLLALDAGDVVAMAADLIAAWPVVGDALEGGGRRREGVADEQVGLHEQLRGQIERVGADVKTIDLHDVLQVLDGEDAFSLIDSIQDGKPFLGLPESVGDEILPELFLDVFL